MARPLLRFAVWALSAAFCCNEIACGDTDQPASQNTAATQATDTSNNSTQDIDPLLAPVPVVQVIDGDTFVVQIAGVNHHIRMKGINTPELRSGTNHDGPAEPYAQAAKEFLAANIGNQVTLEFDSDCPPPQLSTCLDRYGRLLAYVRLTDSSDLGAALLTNGLARVYIYHGERFDRTAEYQTLQQQAQRAGLGIWSQ